jgi:hypothetical protein
MEKVAGLEWTVNSSILIISHHYTPDNSPRAFRWSAIAEYWAKQGYHVDVVCAWKPGLLESEILNGVYVCRTGGKTTESLRDGFGIKKPSGKTPGNQETYAGSTLRHEDRHLVKWIHDHTWKKVYWPDYACLWYFSAVKKAEQLLEKNHYNSLISVSHPFTGHLIGLKLKKKYPQIKWVVDIGDPFCFLEETQTNNHRLYRRLNYKSERKIFNYADAIAVTTKPTLVKYAELFPENASKICVIPPLFSQINNNESTSSLFPKNQKLRLVFIGTLYKNIRSPDYLLFLFSKLLDTDIGNRLELHFFGNVHDCHDSFNKYQVLLSTKIFLHGQVSREKAAQAMKEANVLINIGNNTSYQLPSKVVEYASTGKPILNLVKAKSDSLISFFDAYPVSMCLLEESESLPSAQLDNLLEFIKNPPHIDIQFLEQWLYQFQIETISNAYIELMNRKSCIIQ